MRSNLSDATAVAWLAGMALAGAANASPGKEQIAPASDISRADAGCVAARAVDVQLQAVPADVAYRLEWKRAGAWPGP